MLCIPLKVNRRMGGSRSFHHHVGKADQARNQNETGSKEPSKISVDLQRTTPTYIPRDRAHHNYSWENL
jgi:hypothetical protein